jgi:predicted esterase
MKNIIYAILIIIFTAGLVSAQDTAIDPKDIIKIEANAAKGFAYPYYLYVPPELRREPKLQKETHTILVIPNNTGKSSDDLSVHETDVKKRMTQSGVIGRLIKPAILMPVFPRPATDWQIYTHALDRDALLTDKKEFARFDLQLVAMIDDAREHLKKDKLKFDERVFITGFSASAMFANRFTFLHPDRVKAAAIGSPGGWAIAPAANYKEKSLRYPIGVNDFKTVTGKKFDLKKAQKVPMFIFLGDKDDNDSLVFEDGYEDEDKILVFELFGKTPVERWEISKTLYRQSNMNAEFKIYPNVKHTVSAEMRDDIKAFFLKNK